MPSTIGRAVAYFLVMVLCRQAFAGDEKKQEGAAARIPVTSQMIDVADDPETSYSGAPRFDWAFFGNRTRLIAKYAHIMPAHRHVLGIDPAFHLVETKSFRYPADPWLKMPLEDRPPIPAIVLAKVGKINHLAESGERPLFHDLNDIRSFMAHYPHAIFGGGQVAEVDSLFNWQFESYFGLPPAGPGGAVFPAAYFDFVESTLTRGGAPYMMQQHNRAWGTHYVARERAMSLGGAQLFYRHNQTIVPSLVTLRSAARQYPFPYCVQFSGQPGLSVSNEADVLQNGAEPVFAWTSRDRSSTNYQKSYALCRQVLFLSWLNGARFFNWETGEFVRTKGGKLIPDPLGGFTARADQLIARVGPTGPVQTPIALVSEFSNAWRPPFTAMNKTIDFTVNGYAPYAPGDYQMHGIRDVFFRHYLQSEMIYDNTMAEDHAICATPYGESVDLLLSDVRDEALARYGLVIWTGVPPAVPSMVRDKILRYVKNHRGRVVLFGAAAQTMFPDWFSTATPTGVAAGAEVSYNGKTFQETAAFRLEPLNEAGRGLPPMRVLATVNGKPLVVECLDGLVLVLSDYGLNSEAAVEPAQARWTPGELITQIPHTLLTHARRVLDQEARRQTPFSVGNDNLHYVVTRPGQGQYLLGIFNDRMKAEPFKITSNLGPITTLEDVKLDDGVSQLKSVAGGAVYAPPGLRDSPGLPFDYGPSDASHIEGRGVRLFRLTITERGVREVPKIRYPRRPAGRVLAFPGLGHVRRQLQDISMFFSWFDGVKIDAGAILSVEDSWLADQAYYLDRRGVRVVVDGVGVDEAGLARVLEKLRPLKRAPKDLLAKEPSADLRATAKSRGVRLVDPGDVNRLTAPEHRFKEDAVLNIIDCYYDSEDDLSRDLTLFSTGTGTREIRGKRRPVDLYPAPRAGGKSDEAFVYVGPYISDLSDVLLKYREAFKEFRGIRVDSTYLLTRTSEAVTRDGGTIKELGLHVIVDLRRDQVLFDRIAFYPYVPNYEKGLKLYGEVIRKMKIIASSELVLRINDTYETKSDDPYIGSRDQTMGLFVKSAAEQGVNLHLVCDDRIKFADPSYFDSPNVFVIKGPKGKKASSYRP